MNRLRRIGRHNIKIVEDREDRPGADAVQQEAEPSTLEPSAPEAGLAERGTPAEAPLAEHANGLADAQTAPLVPGTEAQLPGVAPTPALTLAPAPEPEPTAGAVAQAEPAEQLEWVEQAQAQEQEQEQEQVEPVTQADSAAAEPVTPGRPTLVLEQPDMAAGEAEMS